MRSLRAAPDDAFVHGLVSEWSGLPCTQIERVRLPTGPPAHGSTWLERSVRVGEIGGSNPPAQTEDHRPSNADVAQPGRGCSLRNCVS